MNCFRSLSSKSSFDLLETGLGAQRPCGSWKSRQDHLWKMIISPRMVAALMSQGADLCHGWMVIDSIAASFVSSVGMFKFALLQRKMTTECELM